MHNLDTQQIEILGKSILLTELIRNGFEVSEPIRDKGYDLIVYSEPQFQAVPIQMKASTGKAFGIWKKYEKFEEMIYAFIWNILENPRIFLLTYEEAVDFVPDLNGKSWLSNKCYTWSNVPAHLEDKLSQFENRWDLVQSTLSK